MRASSFSKKMHASKLLGIMHACMLPRALEFDLERYETVMGYWYMACDVHEQGLDIGWTLCR